MAGPENFIGEVREYMITPFFWTRRQTLSLPFKRTEGAACSQDLAKHEIVQKWWRYMADIMDANSDYSPVSVPLKEVFRLE